MSTPNQRIVADLSALLAQVTSSGPQWGAESEDLDMTLLSWKAGEGIASHVNDEVDVLVVALDGEAEVAIDERSHGLAAGQAILIPKGCARSILAGAAGFSHLNVHRRRKRLTPDLGGSAWSRRLPPK
jgi:quercetin dioxygenase-like cupin family protein